MEMGWPFSYLARRVRRVTAFLGLWGPVYTVASGCADAYCRWLPPLLVLALLFPGWPGSGGAVLQQERVVLDWEYNPCHSSIT